MPEDIIRIGPPVAFQRGDGAATLRVRRRGQGTVLADLYQRSPCRVLFPDRAADEPLEAVLVTTSGGLAGGDRLEIDIAAAAGSHALVTTQAAEKVYRSLGADSQVSVRLEVAGDAVLEWLPQETILFEGARLDRRTVAEIAPGGRLLAAEMVVFGRLARGESFSRGLWHEAWRIKRDGRLLWADAMHLEEDIARTIASDSGLAAAEALACVLYVGKDAEPLTAVVRGIQDAAPGRAGATRLGDVLIARWLGTASLVREQLLSFLAEFRGAAGLAGRLPRVWYS